MVNVRKAGAVSQQRKYVTIIMVLHKTKDRSDFKATGGGRLLPTCQQQGTAESRRIPPQQLLQICMDTSPGTVRLLLGTINSPRLFFVSHRLQDLVRVQKV